MAIENKAKFKKRINNFILFYGFICITFFASYTFSRYIDTTSGNSQIDIAKFNVTVNGQNVTNDDPFYLKLSDTTNTLDDKMAPNNSGYFEITIDPTGTEVSLDYSFLFNFDSIDSEIRNNIRLINFEANGVMYSINDNFVKGELLLPSTSQAFTVSDKLTLKVNWEWDEDITNPDIDSSNVTVIAVVKQKIN